MPCQWRLEYPGSMSPEHCGHSLSASTGKEGLANLWNFLDSKRKYNTGSPCSRFAEVYSVPNGMKLYRNLLTVDVWAESCQEHSAGVGLLRTMCQVASSI